MAEPITAEERRPRPSDWYLVAALAGGSAIFAALYDAGGFWPFKVPLWVACCASVAVTVPLAWRRRFPSLVAWLICTVYVTTQFLGAMEPGVSQVILFMSVYAIGAWQSDRRSAFLSRLLLCTGVFACLVVLTTVQLDDAGELTVLQFVANASISYLMNIAFFGGAWVFGDRAWRQRQLVSKLKTATEEVRRQGRQLADQALDLERVRIARELHDGVAHHVAGVSIHAAAARRSLEKNPERARESLGIIESSTRETVEELRTLVYTLRETSTPDDPQRSTAGNPGLGDLPALYDSARQAGLRLDVETLGTPRPLTPIAEMSVYRVIQESLTNCHRYAGAGAEVSVRLRFGTGELEVEVSDGPGSGRMSPTSRAGSAVRPAPTEESGSAADPAGTGLGIIGMRERMSALGGTLEAGPKTRGGWLVRARIPYPLGPESASPHTTTSAGADDAAGPAASPHTTASAGEPAPETSPHPAPSQSR